VTTIGILSEEDVAHDYRQLQIIDARPKSAFETGHIPGAIWMGWEEWCEPAPRHAGPVLAQGGYWGVLAPAGAQEYGNRLRSHGLCDDRPIVVYADGPRTRGREGRIAWMLLYLGASTVFLLDGGWSTWLAHRGEVQVGTQNPGSGRFTVAIQPERRATLRALRAWYRAGKLPALIDTRSKPEFDGDIQEYLPRRGHLVGACLFPFADLFEPDGRYIPREKYLKLLPHEARQAMKVVTYCEVGVRASLFAMLHEAYSGQVVAVYEGSVMQWALAPDLPMISTLSEL
jgi:thiosulfate/3-mercaptopyruvate sulfurtransferase